MIPGSNILNQALLAIAQQPFSYYAFAARALNSIGQDIATYAAPVGVQGSVQAVPRNLYQVNGLDFDKYYLKFFVSQDVIDVDRDVSGDLMCFHGNTYQCLSITPWFPMDGWVEILCVKIQNLPLPTSFIPPPNATYNTSAVLNFILNYNQPVIVNGTPYITLSPLVSGTIGGNATYVSGSGGSSLTFAYAVASGDAAHSGIAVASPVVGTITNAAATLNANQGFIPPNLSGIILN
jgi:hypothetical protein